MEAPSRAPFVLKLSPGPSLGPLSACAYLPD